MICAKIKITDIREPVKKSVENSTLGGGGPDRVIFHTFFPSRPKFFLRFPLLQYSSASNNHHDDDEIMTILQILQVPRPAHARALYSYDFPS